MTQNPLKQPFTETVLMVPPFILFFQDRNIQKTHEPMLMSFKKGDNQIRTDGQGVAVPRLTTWLSRHISLYEAN